MAQMKQLLQKVAVARENFITATNGLTHQQASFKENAQSWSIIDNVEHMYWAEFGAINGMWKAMEGFKNNQPIFTGDKVHHGLSIEEVIEKTWRPKEDVPEIAKPRLGGSLLFWTSALMGCQPQLETLDEALTGLDHENIIHPHPISGPINILQRLEFLRFHLERHQQQIENIKKHPDFPKN